MGFGNQLLLAGTALTAIPIILHLIMRQHPQHVMFPALRFLQQRKERNRRSIRFRHLLLLLARCLAIALLVFALARPNILPDNVSMGMLSTAIIAFSACGLLILSMVYVGLANRPAMIALVVAAAIAFLIGFVASIFWLKSTNRTALGNQDDPIAVAIVVDNSLRMDYRHENQTRLEVAQETSQWVIDHLPKESKVAILDLKSYQSEFAIDRANAKRSVDRLKTASATHSLPSIVAKALKEVNHSELSRREVYVMTDLALTAWTPAEITDLRTELKKSPETQVYIIDVGIEKPKNLGLTKVRLSDQLLAGNSDVILRSAIHSMGTKGDHTIRLKLTQLLSGNPDKEREENKGNELISISPKDRTGIEFNLGNLEEGIYQGELYIDSQDALNWDNHQYFTIHVKKAWRVLLVSPRPTKRYSADIHQALAPYYLRLRKQAAFDCKVVAIDEIAKYLNPELPPEEQFDAVCLLDPPPLDNETWNQLSQHTKRGGGLAIFLGKNAAGGDPLKPNLEAFNTTAAAEVMPAKLAGINNSSRYFDFATNPLAHPILQEYKKVDGAVPWHIFRVVKYWKFEELEDKKKQDMRVIIRYNNDQQPALVERSLGKGKVLVMTTPVSDPLDSKAWNQLLNRNDAWPSLILVNEMMKYLVSADQQQLNYFMGDTVVLKTNTDLETSALFRPGKTRGLPQSIDTAKQFTMISDTENNGNYQLRIQETNPLGFSVNLIEESLSLRRISEKELRELFDSENVNFTKDRKKLSSQLSRTRSGIKLYQWICLALAICLACEQLLSSFFYQNQPEVEE